MNNEEFIQEVERMVEDHIKLPMPLARAIDFLQELIEGLSDRLDVLEQDLTNEEEA